MKSKRGKLLRILGILVIIFNIVLIGSFFRNSFEYAKYYSYNTDEILSLSDFNTNEMLSLFERDTIDNNGEITEFNKSLRVFSGLMKFENIKVKGNKHLKIDKKFGDIKVVLVNLDDSKNQVITLDSKESDDIEILEGQYNMILVGKWFKGKIDFK